MKHFNVTFEPDGKTISAHAGTTVLEAAGHAGIILNTVCGGGGTCKKCTVTIEPKGTEVLACEYIIEKDLTVTIPAAARFFQSKILAHGIDATDDIVPDVFKLYQNADNGDRILGIAVDLGTTTIVSKLIDMTDGRVLAVKSALNPQTRYGDDVVTRIAFAEADNNLAILQNSVIKCINALTEEICKQAQVDIDNIYELCLVGNTTMSHIFIGLPISSLGQAPYKPYSVDSYSIKAAESDIKINPAGRIYTVDNIAGFVGSDITAVGLATDIDSADEVTLIVDIGTNGELIMGTRDKLYSASCAAGPALEGARISCGSRAGSGAIEAVVINQDDIDIDVIGGSPEKSICGSGLIDAAAVMLELGIIDNTGRFVEKDKLKQKLPQAIIARITEKDGQPAFILSKNPDQSENKIALTQRDIRQLQLAKAAIRTGIQLLQNKIGVEDKGIKKIMLAGAFGNYIKRESALRIGLLPKVDIDRIIFVGNAASSGAQIILLSQIARTNAAKLARKIEYVEIAHDPGFSDAYADSMFF